MEIRGRDLSGPFWSAGMMLGIEFRCFLSIPVSAKSFGFLTSGASESEWIVKCQREMIVIIHTPKWASYPGTLPHLPMCPSKKKQVTDVAADNRLDDKETLGDFWRREEFEMPGAMKKLKSGSRGCI